MNKKIEEIARYARIILDSYKNPANSNVESYLRGQLYSMRWCLETLGYDDAALLDELRQITGK
jgi:hypothetical protein